MSTRAEPRTCSNCGADLSEYAPGLTICGACEDAGPAKSQTTKYRVLFQAHSDGLAVLAQTDDLGFARQIMHAAFEKFCTPGIRINFLADDGSGNFRGQPVYEPIAALYESVNGKWEWKESCGWTEEGAED